MPLFAGRRLRHDERSRRYAIRGAVAPQTKIRTQNWAHVAPVPDQGFLGACTGMSDVNLLNCGVNHLMRPKVDRERPYLTTEDGVRFYSIATTLDPWEGSYPPEDTGSSGLAAMQALQQLGHISSYWWAFSFDEMLLALQVGPVSVGSWWREHMMDVDSSGYVKYGGDYLGGHQWVVRGVNMTAKRFVCINSWGESWGRKISGRTSGEFYVSFDDMKALLAEDGDVVQPRR